LLSVNKDGYTPQGADPLASAGGIELPAWLSTSPDFGCVVWEEEPDG
jgi:hypothetical protein